MGDNQNEWTAVKRTKKVSSVHKRRPNIEAVIQHDVQNFIKYIVEFFELSNNERSFCSDKFILLGYSVHCGLQSLRILDSHNNGRERDPMPKCLYSEKLFSDPEIDQVCKRDNYYLIRIQLKTKWSNRFYAPMVMIGFNNLSDLHDLLSEKSPKEAEKMRSMVYDFFFTGDYREWIFSEFHDLWINIAKHFRPYTVFDAKFTSKIDLYSDNENIKRQPIDLFGNCTQKFRDVGASKNVILKPKIINNDVCRISMHEHVWKNTQLNSMGIFIWDQLLCAPRSRDVFGTRANHIGTLGEIYRYQTTLHTKIALATHFFVSYYDTKDRFTVDVFLKLINLRRSEYILSTVKTLFILDKEGQLISKHLEELDFQLAKRIEDVVLLSVNTWVAMKTPKKSLETITVMDLAKVRRPIMSYAEAAVPSDSKSCGSSSKRPFDKYTKLRDLQITGGYMRVGKVLHPILPLIKRIISMNSEFVFEQDLAKPFVYDITIRRESRQAKYSYKNHWYKHRMIYNACVLNPFIRQSYILKTVPSIFSSYYECRTYVEIVFDENELIGDDQQKYTYRLEIRWGVPNGVDKDIIRKIVPCEDVQITKGWKEHENTETISCATMYVMKCIDYIALRLRRAIYKIFFEDIKTIVFCQDDRTRHGMPSIFYEMGTMIAEDSNVYQTFQSIYVIPIQRARIKALMHIMNRIKHSSETTYSIGQLVPTEIWKAIYKLM
jgi:hypothetical protein